MSYEEAKQKYLGLVKRLVSSGKGFTITDALNTDYKTFLDILTAEEKDPDDEVIPIEEFMMKHPEI